MQGGELFPEIVLLLFPKQKAQYSEEYWAFCSRTVRRTTGMTASRETLLQNRRRRLAFQSG